MWHCQVQYGCAIIQLLMSRLDENTCTDTVVKTCIVGVLTEIVHVTAEGSIGMSCSLIDMNARHSCWAYWNLIGASLCNTVHKEQWNRQIEFYICNILVIIGYLVCVDLMTLSVPFAHNYSNAIDGNEQPMYSCWLIVTSFSIFVLFWCWKYVPNLIQLF